MSSEALTVKVAALATSIAADPLWAQEKDDLGVSIVGMLLYGFSLAFGRLVLLLDEEQIGEAVTSALVTKIGAARKWSEGLVAEAARSAFDKAHHPGQFQLIGVGHSYYGIVDQVAIINNVFQNISAFRARRVAT